MSLSSSSDTLEEQKEGICNEPLLGPLGLILGMALRRHQATRQSLPGRRGFSKGSEGVRVCRRGRPVGTGSWARFARLLFTVLTCEVVGRWCTGICVRISWRELECAENIRNHRKVRQKHRKNIRPAGHAKKSAQKSLPRQPTLTSGSNGETIDLLGRGISMKDVENGTSLTMRQNEQVELQHDSTVLAFKFAKLFAAS